MGKQQQRMKQRIEERKRAEAEQLKARSEEDEVREALRSYFVELLGLEGADEVWRGFWKVRCHHLWDENYRLNFWTRDTTDWASQCRIQHSFFVKYTPLKGFYWSNPNMEGTFAPLSA